MALFAALSVVLGKFLQIPIGNSIRISFENLTVILAGILFGPVPGMLVGIVADLVGSIIMSYEINPIITLGAATVGLTSGLMFRMLKKSCNYVSLMICCMSAHVIGSMIIKSVGLYLFYSTAIPILLIRIPVYIIIALAEAYIIYLLLKSKAFNEFVTGKKNDLR